MSARAIPVAARLSKRDLHMLRQLRDGKAIMYSRRTAERLTPAFLDVRIEPLVRHVSGGTVTSEGLAVLAERTRKGLRS